MSSAESHAWGSAIEIFPVVVFVGNVQVSSVFVGIVVAVSDKGTFHVVVKVHVPNRDPVACVSYLYVVSAFSLLWIRKRSHIAQAIIVVFAVVDIRGQI